MDLAAAIAHATTSMGVASTFPGTTWTAILRAQLEAMTNANGFAGLLPVPGLHTGGAVVPTLANGQAVALVRAWRTAAGRAGVAWPLWVDLSSYALGLRPPTSTKFDVTTKYQDSALPADGAELLWRSIDQLAYDLDNSAAVARTMTVDWSRAGYTEAAKETWAAMLADGGARPVSTPAEADADQARAQLDMPVPGRPDLRIPVKPPKIPDEVLDEIVDPGGIHRGIRKAKNTVVVAVVAFIALWALTRKESR